MRTFMLPLLAACAGGETKPAATTVPSERRLPAALVSDAGGSPSAAASSSASSSTTLVGPAYEMPAKVVLGCFASSIPRKLGACITGKQVGNDRTFALTLVGDM
jgi:hypothetical protein